MTIKSELGRIINELNTLYNTIPNSPTEPTPIVVEPTPIVVEPTPTVVEPPVTSPPPGSVTWESVFHEPLDYENGGRYQNSIYRSGVVIPTKGIAIAFRAPVTNRSWFISFSSPESTAISTTRTGTINQKPLDFTTLPRKGWGIGGGLWCGVNTPGTDLELNPGEWYVFNIRNDSPARYNNKVIIKADCVVD